MRLGSVGRWVGAVLVGTVALGAVRGVPAQETGEALFQQRCAACHTVGQGTRVGPDLAGVNDRRSEAWLLSFIKSSQAVVKSGDPAATALFKQFNQMVMPDQALSDAQIKAILAHIRGNGTAAGTPPSPTEATSPTASPPVVLTQEEVGLGSRLFQGLVRFENGGPSCISCHHVKNDAIIGGGILAKELTSVFSRVGGDGVRAILGSPPFPVMQAAYQGKPFTEAEIRAVVGFLRDADLRHQYQQPINYGWRLLASGGVGVGLLWGVYALLGLRRKQRSVNQDIYDRQPPSVWE